jgi:hypothetical protein
VGGAAPLQLAAGWPGKNRIGSSRIPRAALRGRPLWCAVGRQPGILTRADEPERSRAGWGLTRPGWRRRMGRRRSAFGLAARAAAVRVRPFRLRSAAGTYATASSSSAWLALAGSSSRSSSPCVSSSSLLAQARRLPRLGPACAPVRSGPATYGHISKQGLVCARHALVEACWTAVRSPGRQHAFYQSVRARRGHSVAVIAAVRKLAACSGAHSREERTTSTPSRRLPGRSCGALRSPPAPRATAPMPPVSGAPTPRYATPSANSPVRPRLPTHEPCATGTPRKRRKRARHRGAHLKCPRRARPRGRPQAPDVCASLRQSLAPTATIPQNGPSGKDAPERTVADSRSQGYREAERTYAGLSRTKRPKAAIKAARWSANTDYG